MDWFDHDDLDLGSRDDTAKRKDHECEGIKDQGSGLRGSKIRGQACDFAILRSFIGIGRAKENRKIASLTPIGSPE